MNINVYIFTIKRARRRQLLCKGGLLTMGVPHEHIKMFYGPDHRAYGTWQDIINAMVADGFPQMEIYRDVIGNRGLLGQRWGYCRFFRHLQETGETALYVHDDAMLALPFDSYFWQFRHFQQYDPHFKIMGLACEEPMRMNATLSEKHFNAPSTDKRYTISEVFFFHAGHVPAGMHDFANFVSPAFSEWFFNSELFTSQYFLALDEYFRYLGHEKIDGFYCLPKELSATRFPDTVTPSMIFDANALKKGFHEDKEV